MCLFVRLSVCVCACVHACVVCSLPGEGVAVGCLPGPIPAAAVTWLRKVLQVGSDTPGELFGSAPDGLNPRTTSEGASPAPASSSGGGAALPPRTPSNVSTPAGKAAAGTPRNSIARLISGKGNRGSMSPAMHSPGSLLGPDGVPVGSLFALADQLSQAAAGVMTTARTAFFAAAEEEAKVSL